MPAAAREWDIEYRFLRAFPGTTHEAYLDTPDEAIAWLLRIHRVYQQVEAEKQEQANRRR